MGHLTHVDTLGGHMPSDEMLSEFDLQLEEIPVAEGAAGPEESTPYSFQGCWTIAGLC